MILYLEKVILQIKQRVRKLQVILVSVIQRRVNSRRRTIHRGVPGTATMADCTTTHYPPPQNPVPPPNPVSVYLHRNVHESMEMNQTLQAVSVVLKDVLLLVRIATQMVIYAVILLLQYAVKKMVLQPTVLPVSVDQRNVLLQVRIAIKLLVLAELYRIVTKKMVLQPTRPAARVAHSIGLGRLPATNRQRTAQAALFVTSRMLAQELRAGPTLPPMWLAFCRLAHLVSRESTDTLVGILTTPYTVARSGPQSSRPRRCAKPRPKASCLESRT